MPEYLIRFTDQDGEVMTSIKSKEAIDVEQAVGAVTEDLEGKGMKPDFVQVDEFTEITNLGTKVRAEIGRMGIF